MKRIISVSRRTDIPAFYGNWFLNRVKEGFAGYVNPFGGQKYIVSLKPDDIRCFVFWSKNYNPFIPILKTIEKSGYKFYFNFTITGLPKMFECNLVETKTAMESLKMLSKMYSPKHINWRYDPIVVSSHTDERFHKENFAWLAQQFEGYVERCYFSYAIKYGKVSRNFSKFQQQNNVNINDPDLSLRKNLANELAEIAEQHGITLMTCSGDDLISNKIQKAHCIDGDIINELFPFDAKAVKGKPTRKECGCVDSTDIGAYDTCPHGCIYCYANVNKDVADRRYHNHDERSPFLGFSMVESTKWVKEIEAAQSEKKKSERAKQMELF